MTVKKTYRPAQARKAKINTTVWLCTLLLVGASIASDRVYDLSSLGGGSDVLARLAAASQPVALTGEVLWFEDFELGWGDWYTDAGVWEIGRSSIVPPSPGSGGNCAGTVLKDNYPAQTDSRLISSVLTLPPVTGGERLELRYWQWYSYTGSDLGYVQISTWNGTKWGDWATICTPTASWFNSGWAPVNVDLTAYSGKMVRIAFFHTALYDYYGDDSAAGPGWYIDDMMIWKGVSAFVNCETFEFGWGGWYTDAGVWQIGKPTSGPNAAHGGQAVAATNLSGNYPTQTDSRLISPMVTLPLVSGEERLELRYWQWYSYTGSDMGYVQISTWNGTKWGDWATICTPTASWFNSNWSPLAVDLTPYAGKTVRLGFYHTALYDYYGDDSGAGPGWYIDDIMIWKGVLAFVNPETFEVGWGDWTTDYGVWEIGKPNYGPTAAHGGVSVAGTNLSGVYPAETDSRLISPPVVLPTSPALQLRFWQWYSYTGSDVGSVQISTWDGSKWGAWTAILTPTAPWANSDWSLLAADLTAYSGKMVRIAFYHTAHYDYYGDDSAAGAGWYIDDVQITPAPESWSLSEDTGISSTDKLTNDTTSELTFVFSQTVRGVNSDIQFAGPDGLPVMPNSVSGWGSSKVVAAFTTPLTEDGQYTVTLKGTITDAQGKPIHAGAAKVVYFTLDTTPPKVYLDSPTPAGTPSQWTGTVDDPEAKIEVKVGADTYVARNNGDGTWLLPEDMIAPDSSARRAFDRVEVTATDRAGNVGSLSDQPTLLVKVTDVDSSGCPVVRATVMVTDLNDIAVGGLGAPNFSVSEDGHPRTLTAVKSGSAISVSLVLDCSDSMGSDRDPKSAMTKTLGAAQAFVDYLSPPDRGEIIKFATQVDIVTGSLSGGPFTDKVSLLTAAIAAPKSEDTGQTALYDAIYQAVSDTAVQPNSRAVVAMTDGQDNQSAHRDVNDIIDHARAVGVPVYTIGLCSEREGGGCTLAEEPEKVLIRIADETGGLYIKAPDASKLKEIYEKIASMLKNQYVVTYDSAACLADNAAGSDHELEIRVIAGSAEGQGTKTFVCPATCKR